MSDLAPAELTNDLTRNKGNIMTTPIARRTFLKGMGGAAGAVLLGACNPSATTASKGGRPTVRVVSWTQLGFPSPFTYTGGPGYWRMSLLFDTLLWPDSTGKQLPWLASSYQPSPDGLVHTLDLRNANWDDGLPVTARDVVFTYEYYTSKTFTPLLIGVPPKVSSVRATGDRSVEFRLDRPDVTFAQKLLGTMPIVPEHIWSTIDDPMSAASNPKALIGTGPYTLASRDEAQDTEAYQAKDTYFLGAPFVKRIEMLPPANSDPLATMRAGGLDAASGPPDGVRDDVVAAFRNDPQYGTITADAGFSFPLFFNMTRGGALADLRFRRACLHAIDREDIVKRLLTGNGQVGNAGWLPPANPFYEPAVRNYPFDRAEAERLLDEAGYRRAGGGGNRTNPDGKPLRYVLNISDSIPLPLAEIVNASLKAVGIDVDLQRIDLVRLFGVKLSASYDMLVTLYPGPAGVGPTGDPELLRGVFSSRPSNPLNSATGYSNPEVDRLIDAQVATIDLGERRRLVSQIQKIVAEDLPVATLYYSTSFYAYRKKVFDPWYYTPGGFGPGISDVYNKQVYVTGKKVGTTVRQP